jgi:hypothetical protein
MGRLFWWWIDMNWQLYKTAKDVVRNRGLPVPKWEWELYKKIQEDNDDLVQ